MEEINLYDLLRFYVQKWLTIVTVVMIGAIAGIIYTYYIQTPQYTSNASLLLVGTNRTVATQDSVTVNNYVQLFKSHRVLDSVIADQEYKKGYDTLAANSTATNVKNTDIINVSISTEDPKTSKALLEGAIQSFRSEAKELYGDNTIKINLVDGASVPGGSSNIKPVTQIGLAAIVGFAAAIIGLFFVYDYRQSVARRHVTPDAPVLDEKVEEVEVPKPESDRKSKHRFGKTVANLLMGDTKDRKIDENSSQSKEEVKQSNE